MATIRIHEDQREKENAVHPVNPSKQHQKNQDVKEKRSTLAVLSNVGAGHARPQGKQKQVLNKQEQNIQASKHGQQMYSTSFFQQKKIVTSAVNATKVLTEQTTKTFVVYEDVQNASISAANVFEENKSSLIDGKVSVIESTTQQKLINNANDASDAARNPLKEIISDGLVSTPMSISDIISPMSIDKSSSQFNEENLPPTDEVAKLSKDSDSFFEVDEYQPDILEYYTEVEKKSRPKPGYMKRQPDINDSMRTILVDWLVEVAEEYRLHTETLYLAVSYIDRFLSLMSVVRTKLQLVGTAALFIAAKYEEIYPPDVGEFVYITDDTYTKAQVLRMEQIILKILSFDLNVPTALSFMDLYVVMCKIPENVKYLALYLSELTLLEGETYLKYLPSQISSAALALSRQILCLPMWNKNLEFVTQYTLNDLKEIILNICQTHTNNSSSNVAQKAIQEKYKSSKYMEVSTLKPIELDEQQLDYLIKEYNIVNYSVIKNVNDSSSNN